MWHLLQRAAIPLRIAAILAVVYLGYVFMARRSTDRRWEDSQKRTQPVADPKFEATYGGAAVKILQFYVRDSAILEDQSTVICYGVLNARAVRIEPPVEGVHPALSNCVTVEPEHDTGYTLTAEGKDGQTVTAGLTVAVKPDPATLPKVTTFQAIKHSYEQGRHYFTIVFRFENANTVSIDPPVFSPLKDSAPFGQWMVSPEKTTTYTLTVTGKKGRTARKQLVIEVPPKG
jgi:hypothetical protein